MGVLKSDARQFAIELARIADNHKSEDVIAVDLRGISSVMDYTIVCTGTSDRQMRTAAERMIEYGKKIGERPYGYCGHDGATWIVIDFVDVVVHIFSRTHRVYYDLELLWGDAPRIEWTRSATA